MEAMSGIGILIGFAVLMIVRGKKSTYSLLHWS